MNPVINSDRVEGTTVYNSAGDKLGSVDHLVIDKVSGQVQYAVLKFGGFLGIGSDFFPVPWSSLKYSKTMDGYVAPIDQAKLEGAPRHTAETAPDYTGDYGHKIGEFWRGPLE